MVSAALPFVEHMKAAAVGFGEARSVLSDDGVNAKPEPEVAAFARESNVTGLEQIGLCMRRYLVTVEARAEAAGERGYATPILADVGFRAAAEAAAVAIENIPGALGLAGRRLTATLRLLVADRNPAHARLVASLVATAIRTVKKAR